MVFQRERQQEDVLETESERIHFGGMFSRDRCVSAEPDRGRRMKKMTAKGRREQEKDKALSSKTADRLTGLLRPTESNIWRQKHKDKQEAEMQTEKRWQRGETANDKDIDASFNKL